MEEISDATSKDQAALGTALESFRIYRRTAHRNITHRRRQNFYALPSADWQLLAKPPFNLLSKFDTIDDAIDTNAEIVSRILETSLKAFGIPSSPGNDAPLGSVQASDVDKVHGTIRQFYRDWSSEGQAERDAHHGPVLKSLTHLHGNDLARNVKVLIPGAGLCRLGYQACQLGYWVECNEMSHHQVLASKWIFGNNLPQGKLTLYPWINSFSNWISVDDQLESVQIPDIHPWAEATEHQERFHLSPGDFSSLYADATHQSRYDVVLTVFFLDTAPNVLNYIRVINHCLKRGGHWINLGPLLWHFEDTGPHGTKASHAGDSNPGSFALRNDELILLVEALGFVVKQHEVHTHGSGYIHNRRSMLQKSYNVAHWVAQKI